MDFTVTFFKTFFLLAYLVSPIIGVLILMIIVLGYFVGRNENWSKLDALYYAFITATTVGYGDFRPKRSRSKLLAILIAMVGLLLTGITVSLGLKAVELCFQHHADMERVQSLFGE